MSRHEASCSCGQLRAIAEGEPVRVSVCHCLACQQRTGSAFGVQARFDPAQVTVTGEWQEYERRADDGEIRRYRFCGRCGSTVFYDFGDEVDIIVIPVGAFADPAFPAPSRVIYEDRRHPWVTTIPQAERAVRLPNPPGSCSKTTRSRLGVIVPPLSDQEVSNAR